VTLLTRRIFLQSVGTQDVGNTLRFNDSCDLAPNAVASSVEFSVRLLSRAEVMGFDLKCKAKDVIPAMTSLLPQTAKWPPRVVLDNREVQQKLGIRFSPWGIYIDLFLKQMRR